MKIKTSKTVTEYREVEVPAYFKTSLYSVMVKDEKTCVFVFNSASTASISSGSLEVIAGHDLKSNTEITREEFYKEFTKAIENMTGFKFEPESDAILNMFSQADNEPSEKAFIPVGDIVQH